MFNSVISTPLAKFLGIDIKDFYLNTPMADPEYMWWPVRYLTDDIIEAYDLAGLIHNGHVLVEINKGMYGLPQAGRIAYDQLVEHLATYGYHPSKRTPGLWKHEWRPVSFCLVVDDFGIKYEGKEHAQHLIEAIQAKYKCSTDWSGNLYCGITLKWDYENRTVDLSMPGYVEKALHKFQHPAPSRPEHAPYKWKRPVYGTGPQLTEPPDESAKLDAAGINEIQQVIGTMLYYGRAVDPTVLAAIGTIGAEQSQATASTAKDVVKLLNYLATHPDATIRCHASGMVLHVHSDASYLSASKARSVAGGHFFLSNMPADPNRTPQPTDIQPPNNGAILTVSTIMKPVLSSAAEAEFGALFFNCGDAEPIRHMLEELGHKQPPTPVQVDNTTAVGIANKTVKQRRSKAVDMRFYWVQDRIKQGHFKVFWRKGADNLGDYPTKHHPVRHHREMRPVYLHTPRV